MPKGQPQQTPWIFESGDYLGRMFRVTMSFDNTTRVLGDADGHRDEDCLFSRFLIGLGEDGSPDDTPTQFTLPMGDSTILQADLNALGLFTIEDVLPQNITAGI